MKRIGLYGGSFDPVHNGHLEVAGKALRDYGLDEVWFIPANVSPFKTQTPPAAAEHRLKMLEMALAGKPQFKLLSLECERPPPSYTVETLRILKKRHPDSRFFLIIGKDALKEFAQWKEPEEIKRMAEPIAFKRGEISSSGIRRRIASGESVQEWVPKEIFDYIQQKMLYL